MNRALTVILGVGLSASAAAQAQVVPSRDSIPPPSIGLTLPQLGLPLPTIGLPLLPTGIGPDRLPRAGVARHTPWLNDVTRAAGRQHPQIGRHGVPSWPTLIYLVPVIGWGSPFLPLPTVSQTTTGAGKARDREPAPSGRVRLELQPGVDPQVYVDGYFVGTLDEVNDTLPLDAGRHTIELRADGYESFELNVQVLADRSTTYRGALKPVFQPVPRPEVPASTEVSPPASTTIYLIPGCYLGNVSPRDVRLPSGCDAAGAVTMKN